MSSSSYKIPFDAFSDAGGHSTSASYITEDTVTEQASPTGENLSSESYLACVGYECLFGESPYLTVDYAVQGTPCDETSGSAPPYTVALGTLTTGAVATSADRFCVRVSTNISAGVVVQTSSTNTALASATVPGDTIPSGNATLTPGATGYGYCSSNAQNGFTASAPFNGSCDTVSNHAVGGVTALPQTVWSGSGPFTNAYGELLTKASIAPIVPAHDDYSDTLTFTVTGTY